MIGAASWELGREVGECGSITRTRRVMHLRWGSDPGDIIRPGLRSDGAFTSGWVGLG